LGDQNRNRIGHSRALAWWVVEGGALFTGPEGDKLFSVGSFPRTTPNPPTSKRFGPGAGGSWRLHVGLGWRLVLGPGTTSLGRVNFLLFRADGTAKRFPHCLRRLHIRGTTALSEFHGRLVSCSGGRAGGGGFCVLAPLFDIC